MKSHLNLNASTISEMFNMVSHLKLKIEILENNSWNVDENSNATWERHGFHFVIVAAAITCVPWRNNAARIQKCTRLNLDTS